MLLWIWDLSIIRQNGKIGIFVCENSENKVCSTNLDLESEFRGLRELAVKSSVGGYADIVNPDISHENSTIVNKK